MYWENWSRYGGSDAELFSSIDPVPVTIVPPLYNVKLAYQLRVLYLTFICEGPLAVKLECTFRSKEISRVRERDMTGIIQVEKSGGEKLLYMYEWGNHLGVTGVDNAGKSIQDIKGGEEFRRGP